LQDQQNNELENILAKLASLSNEDISSIADSIKKVAESQIAKNEVVIKLATVIFDFLSEFDNTTKSEMHSPGTESTLSYATGTKYTRDDLLSIIKTIRKDRATYKTIAEYFRKKNIPTFSGRGEWYAQTIHRLCKTYNLD
jgi:hypothetical protein